MILAYRGDTAGAAVGMLPDRLHVPRGGALCYAFICPNKESGGRTSALARYKVSFADEDTERGHLVQNTLASSP